MAWMSFLGLYRYSPDLFDTLQLPSEIDKDVLVDNLCLETAELEVIYPDPEILKNALEVWSRSRLHTWEKIQRVLYEDYDPFVNIKRDEVRTIETTGKTTSQRGGTSSDTANSTDTLSGSDGVSGSGSDTTTVSAWDASTFQNREKVDRSNGSTTTYGKVDTYAGSGSNTFSNTGEDNNTSKVVETFHVEGDSAITDAQDVALKEVKLRLLDDLYRIILDEARNRFCIQVY